MPPAADERPRGLPSLAQSKQDRADGKEVLSSWKFLDKPGIYLRLDVEQAATSETLRKAANDSLRDGFTACLFRAENTNQLSGKECKRTRECAMGEICNELDRCAPPAQPYNLRVAYRSLRVMSDDWIRDVQEASGDLKLRTFIEFFDDTVKDDLPVVIPLLEKAQYFALVLDEPVENLPVPQGSSKSEALRSVPHPSRVGIWRLADGKLVVRLRRTADVDLKQSGMPLDERVMAAQKRQALSCALAGSVREAMGDANVGLDKPKP